MIFAFSLAMAIEPELDIHTTLAVGGDPNEVPVAFGAGAVVAVPVVRRFHVEVGGDAAITPHRGRWFVVGAGPRYFLWDPERPVVSLWLRGGVGSENELAPVLHGGVAIDLEEGATIRPRVAAGYARLLGEDGGRFTLQVGASFGRRPRPEPAPAAPEPPPPPPPRPQVTGREPGMLWVPEPVCAWLPTEEANARIAELGLVIDTPSVVSTRLLRAPEAPLEPVLLPEIDRGPRPPRVVVAASPRDRVEVEGRAVPVEEGIALADVPEGPARVVVTGGGRSVDVEVFAVADNAVWLPVEPPVPRRIPFRSGRASLARDALERVERLAALRGGWRYQVRGSYSQEGDLDVNRRLAQRRAEAVRRALVEAGVPADAVELVPVAPPDPRLSAADQRAALVIPVEEP